MPTCKTKKYPSDSGCQETKGSEQGLMRNPTRGKDKAVQPPSLLSRVHLYLLIFFYSHFVKQFIFFFFVAEKKQANTHK